MEPAPALLCIDGLAAGYADGGRVLQGLSLALGAGERLAIMGRNGMGKTTLLRTIMGHLRPSVGRVEFAGSCISHLPTDRISNLGVGYVPQGREIFGALTVEENLRLGLLGRKGLGLTIPESLYAHFPILRSRRTQRAGTLSGGEQQQLAVARALVGRPRLLLLDEPGEGIQPSIVQQMVDALRAWAEEEGIAVLLVEQSLDLVARLTRRCLFMENGRITGQVDSHALHLEHEMVVRHLSV